SVRSLLGRSSQRSPHLDLKNLASSATFRAARPDPSEALLAHLSRKVAKNGRACPSRASFEPRYFGSQNPAAAFDPSDLPTPPDSRSGKKNSGLGIGILPRREPGDGNRSRSLAAPGPRS